MVLVVLLLLYDTIVAMHLSCQHENELCCT